MSQVVRPLLSANGKRKCIGSIPLLLIAVASLLCCSAISQTASPTQPQISAFVHVNVVPMDRDQVLPDQTVLVENGKIKAIGSSITVPSGALVIDGLGTSFLSPGLADMHSHSDTRDDLIVYLANGVTTILNMGGARTGFIAGDRIRVNQGEIPGPHVYTSFRVDGTPQYGEFIVTTPAEARSLVRFVKVNGYDFIKVYNNLSSACFFALIDEGRVEGIPVVGHGLTQVGIERQLAAGQILIAHTEEFFYTFFTKPGAEQSDDPPSLDNIPRAIKVVKRYNGFVTADLNTYATIAHQWGNPAVVYEFMRAPETRYLSPKWRVSWQDEDYKQRKGSLAAELAFLRTFTKAMADADIPLVAGTDAPAIPGLLPGFSLHQDLHALEQAGLTPFQVLSTATRVPGEFMRRAKPSGDNFGTISPGSRADLILSTRNPLEDLSTLQKPLGVMAHGHWYTATELQGLLDGVARKYCRSEQKDECGRNIQDNSAWVRRSP